MLRDAKDFMVVNVNDKGMCYYCGEAPKPVMSPINNYGSGICTDCCNEGTKTLYQYQPIPGQV